MTGISIIGVGTMSRTLATAAAAAGHAVQVVGRDVDRAAALAGELGGRGTAGTVGDALTGDLVVLAVPYAEAASVVARYGEGLTGKVVVDITNTFDTARTGLVAPAGRSGAQEIAAAAAAGVHVVKAFNTLFAGVLAAGTVEGRPVDVFMAGDDADAKKAVAEFVESLGMRPRDAGDLVMAHWLEGAGLLILGQAIREQDFSLSIGIRG